MSLLDTPSTPTSSSVSVAALMSWLVPLVTIIGTIVLLALHDIDQAAGVGLIAGLAGLHGGASVATASK